MALLDKVEALLAEGAASALIQEHITLANEKHVSLEHRVRDLESHAARLEADCVRLREENAEMRRQLENSRIGSRPADMDAVREKVLEAVANNEGCDDHYVAHVAGVSPQVAKFHLVELKAARMVTVAHLSGSDWMGVPSSTKWSLTQAGRGHLIARGLIR